MCHKKYSVLGWICFILVVIGGINWGLVGIFGFNLVAFLFGAWPIVERIIYVLVGVAAVILIFFVGKCCRKCNSCSCKSGVPPNPTGGM